MQTVKVRLPVQMADSVILPLAVPDLSEVNAFAMHLHLIGKSWHGEVFGWPVEYTPESRKKPQNSKMAFTPADFCIGESGIWFYSLMWEHGKINPPTSFLDDRGIVRPESAKST